MFDWLVPSIQLIVFFLQRTIMQFEFLETYIFLDKETTIFK